MPQTFAIILFLNSFKILLLFPNSLLLSHIILNKWSKKYSRRLLYCSISEHSTQSCRLHGVLPWSERRV